MRVELIVVPSWGCIWLLLLYKMGSLRIALRTHLFFKSDIQKSIRYYSATPKERYSVEEVARVTWARQKEEATGIKATIRPAFA